MYKCFPVSAKTTQVNLVEPEPKVTLETAPILAMHMELYNKYDMIRLAKLETSTFTPALRECLQLVDALSNSEIVPHVLHCAAAAEKCGLVAMLALCEAIVVKHFSFFICERDMLSSKLSSASMLRIAECRNMVQEHVIDDLAKEARDFAAIAGVAVSACTTCQGKMTCPRCSSALSSTSSICASMKHPGRCKCSQACRWPHELKTRDARMDTVYQHLAAALNISVGDIRGL